MSVAAAPKDAAQPPPAPPAARPAQPAPARLALHPLLIAAFPIMTVWAGNIREVTLVEGLTMLAAAAAFSLALTLGLRFAYPSQRRAALAATWLVLLTFSFGYSEGAAAALVRAGVPNIVCLLGGAAIWLAIVAGGLAWLRRKSTDAAKLSQVANVFAWVLSAVWVLVFASAVAMNPWFWRPGDAALAPPPADIALTAPPSPPDVYYLVFDRYGSEETLRDEFDHDNGPFLEGLRRRGFYVADESQANYPKTELSMASALNMRYHGEEIWPKQSYRGLLQNHLVGRLFKEQGYRYYHLGNKHTGLRTNANADWNDRFSPLPTELAEYVFRMTPAYPWFPTQSPAEQSLGKFSRIAEIAGDRGPQNERPKFVYAHFMLPHEPWKFDRDGRLLSEEETDARSETENYRNQLAYTNRRIAELVDAILARAARPPIIIIQADEGPELRYEGDAVLPRRAQLEKRCGIISAFLLPGRNAESIVPPGITPVNTFRLIFREYFAADLPPLADRTFYWDAVDELGKPDLTAPCRFVDVTSELMQAP